MPLSVWNTNPKKKLKKIDLKKSCAFFCETKFPYIKEISKICWGYAIDLKFGQDLNIVERSVSWKFHQLQEARLPASGDLYGYYVDLDTKRMEPWEKIIPSFKYDPEVCVFVYLDEIIVNVGLPQRWNLKFQTSKLKFVYEESVIGHRTTIPAQSFITEKQRFYEGEG